MKVSRENKGHFANAISKRRLKFLVKVFGSNKLKKGSSQQAIKFVLIRQGAGFANELK